MRFSLAAFLSLALAAGIGSVAGAAEWCGDVEQARPEVAKGSGLAELLEVEGSVAVVRVSGPYDRYLDGELNQAVRAAVAAEALQAFGDQVDFLTVLTTFDFDRAGADAFAVGIQNDVEGIGKPIFDYSQEWGSDGELELYVDLGPIAERELDPVRPAFERTLTIALHEIFHRWLFSPTIDQAGLPANGLTGAQGSHWSFLADSDASLLYGADWRDDGDGGHTAVQVLRRLSPLDLYLSGFYAAAEVPPVRLILDPNQDSAALPFPGARAFGPVVEVPIDSVLEGLGPRVPAVDTSPKSFRVGFVVLVRDDVEPVPIRSVERLAEQVATRFTILTAGRGRLGVAVADGTVLPGSPDPVGGGSGDVRPSADIGAAISWLRLQQEPDGSWADLEATRVRDTALASRALIALDASFAGVAREAARQWLADTPAAAVDSAARKVQGLLAHGAAGSAPLTELEGLGNAGRWGPGGSHTASVLDSALAAATLHGIPRSPPGPPRWGNPEATRQWLLGRQNPDGGWGISDGGAARLAPTARALSFLAREGEASAEAIDAAVGFLAGLQRADGGFGDDQSSPWLTAEAIEALLDAGRTSEVDVVGALAYLDGRQRIDGSWDGSIGATAAVLTVLPRLEAPDLTFLGAPEADPIQGAPGQPIALRGIVINRGTSPSAATSLHWTLDAAEGEVVAEAEIPSLLPSQRLTIEAYWATENAESGEYILVGTIDPDGVVAEASELDNSFELGVILAEAPLEADLSVAAQEISLIPRFPDHVPSEAAFQAVVRNLGQTAAEGVRVVVAAVGGDTFADLLVDVAAQSSVLVEAHVAVLSGEPFDIALIVDPDEQVPEASEDNNLALLSVVPSPSWDAAVSSDDVVLEPAGLLIGETLRVGVVVGNRGTLDIPELTTRVEVLVDGVVVLTEEWSAPVVSAGETNYTLPWTADRLGAGLVVVTTDVGNEIPELDEGNNVVAVPFTIQAASDPNLAADALLTLVPDPPWEGGPLAVTAAVRNTGGIAAPEFDVALFDGDPAGGGIEVDRQAVVGLDVAAMTTVQLVWSTVPDATPRLLFVIVDPDQAVVETREDDNHAWVQVTPARLPDLVATPSAIHFIPGFPVGGQPVEIVAEIRNLGGQRASGVLVRALADEQWVGETVLAEVASGGTAVARIPWTTPELASTQLRLEVDPDGAIPELREDNNTASVGVPLQDQAAAVSERYFSPNGDGVKDSVTFSYRVSAGSPVAIEVRDRYARVYREVELDGSAAGSWVWDGEDGVGRLVRDGDWTIAVVGASGSDLGSAVVTLDTNRSPWTEAIGTGYESTVNLTCQLEGSGNVQLLADESRAYMLGSNLEVPGQDKFGIHQAAALRSSSLSPVRIYPSSSMDLFMGSWALDPLSATVAARRQSGIELVDGPGAAHGTGVPANPLGFLPESHSLLVVAAGGFSVFDRASGQLLPAAEPAWNGWGSYQPGASVHPTRDLYLGWSDGGDLVLVEPLASQETLLRTYPPSISSLEWSPTGTEVAIAFFGESSFWIYGDDGAVVDQPVADVPDLDWSSMVGGWPVGDLTARVVSASWSSSTPELVVAVAYEEECGFRFPAFWTYDLSQSSWELQGLGLPENFCHSLRLDWDGESRVVHFPATRGTETIAVGDVDGSFDLEVEHLGSSEGWIDWIVLEIDGRRIPPSLVDGMPRPEVLDRVDGHELEATGRAFEMSWEDVEGEAILVIVAREPLLHLSQEAGRASQKAAGAPAQKSEGDEGSWAGRPYFVPGSRSIILVDGWDVSFVDLDDPGLEVRRFGGDHPFVRDARLSPTGRGLIFESDRDQIVPDGPCFDEVSDGDSFHYRSLLNLENYFEVRRPDSGSGYVISGSAADKHFFRRRLEAAPFHTPASVVSIGVPSNQPVVDDVLGVWAPAHPGSWLIRQIVEDHAGNTSVLEKRVEVAAVAPIANLRVEPGLYSPLLGPLAIRFDLLVPLQTSLQIVDERDGRVVRDLPVSLPCCVGDTAEVSWDGRDQQGRLVGSGGYKVNLLGFEVLVVVDIDAPSIALTTIGTKGIAAAGATSELAAVVHKIGVVVEDSELAAVVLERGEGPSPVQWVEVPVTWGLLGPGVGRASALVESSPAAATGANYRVIATDWAGNVAQELSGAIPEQLVLFGVAEASLVDGSRDRTLRAQNDAGTGLSFSLTAPTAIFSVGETVVASFAEVFVEVARAQGPWITLPMVGFFDPLSLTSRSQPPEGWFDAAFELDPLIPGEPYRLRLRAVSEAGAAFVSNAISVTRQSVQIVGRAWPAEDRPAPAAVPEVEVLEELLASLGRSDGRGLLWARHWLSGPIQHASLRFWSQEPEPDPRFVVPVVRPLLASHGNVLVFELPPDVREEYEYRARVELLQAPSPGELPKVVFSPPGSFGLPEVDFAFVDLASVDESRCPQASLDRWLVELAFRTPGDDPAAAVTLERRLPDDSWDIAESVLFPSPDRLCDQPNDSWSCLGLGPDSATWPAGTHELRARLVTVNGVVREVSRELVVDRTLPEIQLLSPRAGELLCSWPTPELRLRDTGATYLGFNKLQPFGLFEEDVAVLLPPGYLLSGAPTTVPGYFRAVDQSGNAGCLQASFVIDLSADSELLVSHGFSPNADGLMESLPFTITSLEALDLSLAVSEGTLPAGGECLPLSGIVRTVDIGSLGPGLHEFEWDGRDETGLIAPDATYALRLLGTDGCGHAVRRIQCAKLDTTSPALSIVNPLAGAGMPVVAEVWIEANDGQGVGVDPSALALEYSEGASGAWTALEIELPDAYRVPATPFRLATWNTFGLEGPYLLRLSARDRAGNPAEVVISVDAGGAEALLSDLVASPSLFSPNGDGRREAVTVRYTVESEARVRLSVRDENDLLVRVLEDALRQPGVYTLVWDGFGGGPMVEPDGTYSIVAEAFLPGSPAVQQEESVTVELDATAPVLDVTNPTAEIHVPTPTAIEGSVDDLRLVAWSLAAAPGTSEQWELLAEDTQARIEQELATLEEDFPEGPWRLRLDAEDAAENRSSVVFPFVVDRTPPEVAITAPAGGSLFGPSTPAIAIEGSVFDANLAIWRLEAYAQGSSSERVLIAEGETSIEGLVGTLLGEEFADGSWTIELSGEDLAGNRGAATVTITLDRTPPVIDITSPQQLEWIRTAPIVAGGVADPHLFEWRLAAAPGAAPAAAGFATVAAGYEPVAGSFGTWMILPPDGPATLRLTAVDAVGNSSTLDRLVHIDTVPPPRPLLLKAERIAHRDVLLEWNAVVDPHLAGYVLERGSLRITPAPVPGPTFTDVGVPDGIHEYRVRAVDLAGNESEPSAPAVVAIDSTPPVVQIAVPSAGSWIRGLTNLEGTARSTQDDFREYWLEVGSEALGWTEFRRSPAPVIAAHLGSWTPPQALDGATVRFRLSAADLADNVASTEVEVQIDLTAPAAPIELVATPAPEPSEDVILTWTASTAPDLAGYVVLRGGAARFPWEQPIEPTTWTDPSVPDGTFTWTVVAVDHAGNQSAESNPATLTLDRHPPRAVIRTPVDGHRFDGPLAVLATSEDRDVATVQLEWRLPDGPWTPLAGPLSAEPWTATLDPEALALSLGSVELRAVATDLGGRVDPDPQVTTIEYADLTAPPVPLLLVAAIDGDVATLTWDATGSDATSFRVEERFDPEDPEYLEVVGEVPEPTAVLPDLPLGLHHWQVVAIDDAGNESEPSNLASGLVHRPLVSRHMTPRLDPAVDLVGTAELTEGIVQVRVEHESGSIELLEIPLGADGRIEVSTVPLTSGDQSVEVRVVDPDGNRSLPDTLWLFFDHRPAAPAGLAAAVDGLDVTLTWEASTETDHLGWRVWRDGVVSPAQAPATIAEAIGDEWTTSPTLAIDGDPETAWEIPDAEESELELELGNSVIVDRLELLWANEGELLRAPLELRVEAWDGRDWIPVADFAPLAAPAWSVPLDRPYRTSRLRLSPRGSISGERYLALALAELQVVESPVLEGPPEWLETVADGVWSWEVEQVDTNGFVSDLAAVETTVGDVDPPLPVILSGSVEASDASLSWTASESPDVVAYDLRRDGVLILRTSDLATIDPGLANGTYTYEVRALDAAFNESPPSNEVELTVFVEAPSGVIELEVSEAPDGDALDLAWTWSLPEQPAGGFRVRRGLVQGGPWAPRATVAGATTFRDDQVDVGVTYYYVVAALDQVGNAGPPSNEASGSLVDLEPPEVPVPFFPGGVGDHVQTVARQQDFAAWAEPGVEVRLIRNGVDASTTVATSAWANTAVPGFDVSYSPEVSPDGRWLVAFAQDDDGVLVARTVDRSGQIVSGTLALDGARWSDSSTEFVGWRNGEVWRFDPTGTGIRLWQADAVAAVARDGERSVIVVTEEDGIVEVWERDDLSSEVEQVAAFAEDESVSVWDVSVELSPDQRRLAWYDDYGLAIVDLELGLLDRVHWSASSPRPAWSPDSRWVAWTNWDNRTAVYDTVTGTWTDFGEEGEHSASWSPNGTTISLLDGAGVVTNRTWPTGDLVVEPGFPAAAESEIARWLPSGELMLFGPYRAPVLLTPPGRASFVQIPLLPGVETFYFAAVDNFGNRSAAAGPVSVERLSPSGPDLVVPEFGAGVTPAAPAIGEQVRITASAGNVGSETAAASRLRASLLTADGQWQQVIDTPVPALAPGATFVRDVLLPMPGPAGLTSLVVEADATGVVIETDETNNRRTVRVPVGQTASADLTLSLDRTLYGPGIPIEATTTVDGFGAPIALVLRRWVADGAGVVIEELEAEDLGILLAGERRELVATWSHAGVFSGSYQFVAQLSDPSGAALVERAVSFEVAPWHQIVASIIPRPSAAERGAAFDLDGRLEIVTGNALLVGAEAVLEVRSAAGVLEHEVVRPLGVALPGTVMVIGSQWQSGTAAAGLRGVHLQLRRDGVVLASASALLEVMPLPAVIAGDLDAPAEVVLGTDLAWSSEVENTGDLPLEAMPIRVRLLDGTTLAELGTLSTSMTVPPASPVTWPGELESADLAPGVVLLVLEAEVDGAFTLLDQAAVLALDRTPPELEVLVPTPGQVLGHEARLIARATDRHGNPVLVEAAVDGGALTPAPALDPAEATYSMSLAGPEGLHAVAVEAVDVYGNRTIAPPVPYELDLSPPVITILGVVDGEVRFDVVTPEIIVTDPHLDSWSARLDGLAFTSGTPIAAAGAYELVVVATDTVGNRADATMRFTIATAAVVEAELVDQLWVDLDGDGAASIGDQIRYELTVEVEGADAEGLRVLLPLPLGTSIVAGSVITSHGAIATEQPPTVELGVVPSEAVATVSVVVEIGAGAGELIEAQGFVSGPALPALPTDDPALPGPADPTFTVVGHRPHLVVSKRGTATGTGGVAGLGETIAYQLVITNLGTATADGVTLLDPVPVELAVNPGTVGSTAGAVVSLDPLEVEIGAIAAGASVLAAFDAVVAGPLAPGVEYVENQATVTAPPLVVLSDDPSLPGPADPTRVPLLVRTRPTLTLAVDLLVDADGDGALGPGDHALYLLEAQGADVALAGLSIDLTFPPWVVVHSVIADQGTIVSSTPLAVAADTLAARSRWRVSFELELGADAPEGAGELVLQALLGDSGGNVLSDDPTTAELLDPTVLPTYRPSLIHVEPVSVVEGDSGPTAATLLLTFVETARPGSITWATRDGSAVAGSDYLAAGGTVEVVAGATSASIALTVLGDEEVEGDESFWVDLVAASGFELAVTEVAVTIVDDDEAQVPPAVVTLGAGSAAEGAPVVLTLARVDATNLSRLLVRTLATGSATPGADFVPQPGVVVEMGPGVASADVLVATVADGNAERDETIDFEVEAVSGAEVPTPIATATILDDDGPVRLAVAGATATEGEALTFQLTTAPAAEYPVAVEVFTADASATAGEDYVVVTTTVTIAPGSTSAEVVVTTLSDDQVEGDEELTLNLQAPVDAEIEVATAVGLIRDQTTVPTPVLTLHDETVDEDGFFAEVRVSLDRPADEEVRVSFATREGTAQPGLDYLDTSGEVLIGVGGIEATLLVPLVDDAVHENTEAFFVDALTVTGATLGTGVATVTIVDDDLAPLRARFELTATVDGLGAVTVAPGALVDWSIEVEILDGFEAAAVELANEVPDGLELLAGSVLTSHGVVIGLDPLRIAADQLPAGALLRIGYTTRVAPDLDPAVLSIANQATVLAERLEPMLSDDPATATPADPTVITIDHGVPPVLEIPTLGRTMLLVLILLVALAGLARLHWTRSRETRS